MLPAIKPGRFIVAIIFSAPLVSPAAGQKRRLYMLSGTSSPGFDLPVRLYSVDPDGDKGLELVRDVAQD